MARKPSAELQALRAQALKRERDVARKVARYERQGVALKGSVFDTRKGAASVNRMTTAQVQAHLKRLDKTMSRKNQFVATADRQPVKRSTWRAYQRAERASNRKVQGFRDMIAQAAGKDTTFEDTNDDLFQVHSRLPGDITRPGAVRALTRVLKRNSTDEGFDQRVKFARENIEKMVIVTGDLKMMVLIRSMSDAQVIALWETTGFAKEASLKYHLHKGSGEHTTMDRGDIGMSEIHGSAMYDMIARVKKLSI